MNNPLSCADPHQMAPERLQLPSGAVDGCPRLGNARPERRNGDNDELARVAPMRESADIARVQVEAGFNEAFVAKYRM